MKYMNKYIHNFFSNMNNLTNSMRLKKLRFILITLSGVLLLPLQETRSEEVFLKCIGKFEINRGALIKPDWETIYLSINLNGLKSTIHDKGVKTKGRTLIRRNSYTITHRDNKNNIKNIFKINRTHGNYIVDSPQTNRTLIGTCQKSRG